MKKFEVKVCKECQFETDFSGHSFSCSQYKYTPWNFKPRKKRSLFYSFSISSEERIKRNARVRSASAIRSGTITRLPCEVCGNPKSEAHHVDYNRPLDLTWLCSKHHKEEHKRLRLANKSHRSVSEKT